MKARGKVAKVLAPTAVVSVEADSAADVTSTRRGRKRRSIRVTTMAAFGAIVATVGIVSANPASASTGAYGVVAVHTGSWGYREVVLGRGTTQQWANSPWWDLGGTVATTLSLYGLPFAVDLYLVHYEAQQAANSGRCVALVRSDWWLGWSAPGVESWGCR